MSQNGRFRLVIWLLLAVYVAYLLGLASTAHLVTDHLLSAAAMECVWYSLSCAAVAVGCWIALGDGNAIVRFVMGAWGLICVWIVWQASIYIYAVHEPGEPGSTSEGFTVYAAGHAVIALVVTYILVAIVRVTTGLCLSRDPSLGPLIATRTRFTLAEFLCGVAICATTLGAARLVAPRDLTYFTWFTLPKEVLNFVWIWTYTAIIAIPTALMLVFFRRLRLPCCYFLATITALVLQQKWAFFLKMPLSGWKFYWLLQTLRMVHVVIHVGVVMAVLKWEGYSLTWRWRVSRPTC
jgi:hypothetical protein